MTASTEEVQPTGVREAWLGLKVFFGAAWRADPVRTTMIAGLVVANAGFMALNGLWLKMVTDGVLEGDQRRSLIGAVGLAVSLTLTGTAQFADGMMRWTVIEGANVLVERDLLLLSAGLPGIEHLERPDHLDRLETLRNEVYQLLIASWSPLSFAALLIRVVGTSILLASLHPALLLLPVFGVPSFILGKRAELVIQRAKEATAESARLDVELLDLGITPGPAKELRVFGLAPELDARGRALWDEVTRTTATAQLRSSFLNVAGSLSFYGAYVVVIAWIALRAFKGHATAGDVAMAVIVGQEVQGHVAGGVGVVTETVGLGRAMGRYLWFRTYSEAQHRTHPQPAAAPDTLVTGIELADVSFAYPGTDLPVLSDVNLVFPAGSVVAIVGENGAGKSTLVKLLCGFYQPTAGAISVDGIDLTRIPASEWRRRLSAGFQDLGQWELTVRQLVGLGDLTRIDDDVIMNAAIDQADARTVVDALPDGLDALLGRQFGGSDVSMGQWQRLVLARALMRPSPLVLLLDEPTSALDAAAEHRLFERYTSAARSVARASGALTILVSHRFSTVGHADHIVVMQGGRITEVGGHDELIRSGGLYAELFELQRRAYT
jgi:ATP-binding cassette subfamily B protein